MDVKEPLEQGKHFRDYDRTAGAVRHQASSLNHNQPGDAEKFARQIIAFADVDQPRVPMLLEATRLHTPVA